MRIAYDIYFTYDSPRSKYIKIITHGQPTMGFNGQP